MAPFLPVRATSRSQAVRIGKQRVKQGSTTYVDLAASIEVAGGDETDPELAGYSAGGWSPYKELQNHLAIGAVIVVGPLTNSSSDWVVVTGAVASVEGKGKAKEETEYAVTASEELRRSTGKYLTGSAGAKVKAKNTGATKERIDLLYILVEGEEAGTVKLVEGVEAAKEKAVVPATPAKSIPLAKIARYNEAEVKTSEIVDVRPRP